jgi:DNA-binding transcriptional LysR family regulator
VGSPGGHRKVGSWRGSQEDLAAGQLVQPFDLVGDDGHSYWLVYPEGRRLVPKIKAFRDWASRQAGVAGDGV